MNKSKQDTTEQLARTVIRVNLAFRQFIQARFKLHNIDLTFEMLQVLGCLWDKDGINQQEIADQTIKDKASITYLLDNIEKRGLLYRKEDEQDRRNKLVYLTEEGTILRKTIRPWIEEMYRNAGRQLSLKDLNTTIEQLELLRDGIINST